MEYLYYLNHQHFTSGDTRLAWNFAKTVIKENKDVDTVTFLVYQQRNYETFLGEMNFSPKAIREHGFTLDNGFKIQIHTVQTYRPSLYFVNEPKRELLIAVGVPPKDLEQFIDSSRVKYWIVVPWTLDENMSFLKIFNAVNIETEEKLTTNFAIDDTVKKAVLYLKATSYPNEGYHHPLDEKRLKSIANAITTYNIPFDTDSLIHYCYYNGFTFDAAKKTAEYFGRAKNRRFSIKGGDSPQSLMNLLNGDDFDEVFKG